MLRDRGVLLADGGTGTNYQDRGIEPGVAPEEWLFDEPDHVMDLHRSFAEEGYRLGGTTRPLRFLEMGKVARDPAETVRRLTFFDPQMMTLAALQHELCVLVKALV